MQKLSLRYNDFRENIFNFSICKVNFLGIGVFYSSQKIDIWLAYLLFHADKNNLRNSEEYFAYCKNHGMESGLNKYAISNLIRKNRWLWNLFSTLKEIARDLKQTQVKMTGNFLSCCNVSG